MPTDRTLEATTPDTIQPDDALTLALTSRSFAKHVVQSSTTEGEGPDAAGARMHPEARKRHNAKMIRLNKIKASELGKNQGKRKDNPGLHAGRTSVKPLWDADQLRQRLQSYDRTPFLDILAIWMECAPTPQTIMAFADKYPDRWTKAMLDLGRLGGFAEKKEIDFNFAAQVARMSDSQLEDQLREHAYRLGIPLPALLRSIHGYQQEPETLVGKVLQAAKDKADAVDAEVVPATPLKQDP